MNTPSPSTNPERCSLPLKLRKLLGGLLLFAITLLFAQSALAAVAFRAATSAVSGGASVITATSGAFAERTTCGSVTPAIPVGNVGDLLIAQVVARRNASTVTMSGWNTLFSDNVAGADYQVFLFWLRATGTDPNTIIQSGTCDHLMARITRFGNVDTAQPLETQPLPAGNWFYTNAGDVDTGTQNIAVANSMLVLATFVADNRNVAQDGTFTQLYDNDDGSGADAGFSLNYRTDVTTGNKGPFLNMDLSGTGSYPNHGVLFAVRPTPGGGAGLTINKPTGTITEDVMVASIAVTPSTVGITPPPGWTIAQNTLQTQDASSHLTTYYKIATDSEPVSYSWNFSASHSGAVGGITTFSGVDTTNPIVSSASLVENGNTALSHTAPSINASADDMLVTVHEYQSSGTWAPPSGMIEAVDKYSEASNSANGVSLGMNYLLLASTGATGPKVATASNDGDEGASQSLALKSIPLTCFNDNFNGSLSGNWVMTNESGTFGNPRIVNQRLRLTDASTGVSTMAALRQLFPAAGNKIVVEFDHFAYNGSGADGMCVVLSDASIAPVPGAFGGSLGYAPKQVSAGGDTTHAGFAGGWLGIALDEYGNFSNPTEGRTGGPGFRPDSVAIRGSGSVYTGYTYLTGTATLAPGLDNTGSTSAAPGYRYRITIDHTDGVHAYTSVERNTGSGYTSLIAPLDAKAAIGQAAVPANWFLSFTGTTGSATNIHEFDNLQVCTTQPQPLPTLDHVRILHDGCAQVSVAETVTLKACADADCSALYLGPVTVDLTNISSATWSSDPVSFSGGQTTITLTKSTTDTVILGGTITSPTAATHKTAVCYNGATQTCSLSSSCFDAVEVGQSASTPIYTKLANTGFALDVLALTTGFTGPVSVALVDPTSPSGNCSDKNTGLTAEAAYSFIAPDNGRHTFNFNYPYAAKNVKVRIRNTTTDQSVCSSDNFAIRPLAFTVSASLGGTTLAAGNNFTMTAASGVTAGYTGIPALDTSKLRDHNNAAAGTFNGNFAAATGANATGTFQYHDVGTISLLADAITDPSFTSVDQPADCVTASTSNTLASGKYGCVIGSAATGPFGRFYPHHFTYTAALTPSCTAGDFTYMGDANLGISLSLQAKSADESVTARYTNGYTPIGTFMIAGDNSGAAIPVTRLSPALPPFTWNAGAYNYIHTALGDRTTFTRSAAPDGSYENFALKASVADPDGAALLGTTLSNTTKIRYGRLRLPNAYGPETEPIIMPARLEYYNGSAFALNTQDSCTNPGGVATYRLDNTLEVNQIDGTIKINGNSSTTLTVGAINAGIINLTFSPPGSGKTGYADVTALIATPLPWLLYEWDGLDNDYNENPSARVNFGLYRGNDRIINWREIIR